MLNFWSCGGFTWFNQFCDRLWIQVPHGLPVDTGVDCVLMNLVSCSVYSGHQSILIPPSELETNPALWLLAVSQYKVRDTFCSYSVMELCTKGLGSQTESLKVSGSAALHALHFGLWEPWTLCWMSAGRKKSSEGTGSFHRTHITPCQRLGINTSHSLGHRAIKLQGKAFIYPSSLMCVAACVDRQVLENRGINVQEVQGVLHCTVCFMNTLVIWSTSLVLTPMVK